MSEIVIEVPDKETVMKRVDLAEIAKIQKVELEEVLEAFNGLYISISKTKAGKGKSQRVLIKRAKNALDSYYSNKPKAGEKMVYIIFGPKGNIRDWNATYRKTVEGLITKQKLSELIKNGMVMTMNGKAVSQVTKTEARDVYVKDGLIVEQDDSDTEIKKLSETIVTEGTLWKMGQRLIIRDNVMISGKFSNKGWSKKLRPRYSTKIVGLMWKEGDTKDIRLFNSPVYGNQGDPTHDDFIFKHYSPFTVYSQKFVINEDKCKKYLYDVSTYKIDSKAYDTKFSEDIDINIEDILEQLYDDNNVQAAKDKNWIPRVYTLDKYKEYHETAKVKVKGKWKNDGGWDNLNWDAYAILVTNVMKAESKKGTIYYIFSDSAMGSINVFAEKYTQSPGHLPATCLCQVTTGGAPYNSVKVDGKWDNIPCKKDGDINIRLHTITALDAIEVDVGKVEE